MNFLVKYTDRGKEFIDKLGFSQEYITKIIEQMINKKIFKIGQNKFIYPFEDKETKKKYSLYGTIREDNDVLIVKVDMIATEIKSSKPNLAENLDELAKKDLKELTVGEMLKLKRAGKLNK